MNSCFHPAVAAWFGGRFREPTAAQARGWPAIQAGSDVLIAAPTGSGKTLAAFLAALDGLLKKGLAGRLEDRTEVLYVSPLKALGNDVEKNLAGPLAGIRAEAEKLGLAPPEIRTAVRTGDTQARERRLLARRPAHVLITTPESMYILLTSESGRRALRTVGTVIVDEIHAVVQSKRGSHLALSLERLEALCEARPVRVGLSATQKPIEEVGRFLVGAGRPAPVIVDEGHARPLDLAVEVPRDELSAVASAAQWAEVLDRVAEHIRAHRTTLVFTNTRRLVERVSHQLAERLGAEAIAAHHGSLSRSTRLLAEERLKEGRLKAIVATASLELGIDVGEVDLVVQLGTPRSIAVCLQRVGRSGHWLGAVPKGRIFALSRDELCECAALVRSIRQGTLDRLAIPEAPLDVLAQQLVATAAALEKPRKRGDSGQLALLDDAVAREQAAKQPLSSGRPDRFQEAAGGNAGDQGIKADALFALARRAWPYRNLARADFDAVLAMLAEGVATARGRSAAHLHHDRVNQRVRARRGARLASITSGGAIPDTAQYAVIADPDELQVGTLDEDFAIESMAGDIFLLGNTSWRIRRVERDRVRVEDAHGLPPSIPFWNGEAPARTRELSQAVSTLREEIARDPARAPEWLTRECGLDAAGAAQAAAYVAAGAAALGAVPSQRTLVAERFFDEAGGMQLIIHAPFGGRLNRAFGLALRKRFCRTFDFELQAAATDDGVLLSLGPQHSFPLETVFEFLRADKVEPLLVQAILAAPMFQTRWRWNATRSLAVLRHSGGKKVPAPIQRIRAQDLLAAVFPMQQACAENHAGGDIAIPDHPLVAETVRDCLHEAMDVRGLEALLRSIEEGQVRLVARDVPEPSPFSHAILNSNPYTYLDDAPLEERRARAVSVRRGLPAEVAQSVGALDPEAIAAVTRDAWPSPRDAEELHDALLTLGALPESEGREWKAWFGRLCAEGRAGVVSVPASAPDPAPGLGLPEERSTTAASQPARAGALPAQGELRSPAVPAAVWVAAERLDMALAALGPAEVRPPIAAPEPRRVWEREEAQTALLRGFMECAGPVTVAEISERLGLPPGDAEAALLRLEAEGTVLRGRFRCPAAGSGAGGEPGSPCAGSAPARAGCEAAVVERFSRPSPGGERSSPAPAAHLREQAAKQPLSSASKRPSPGSGAGAVEFCDRRLLSRIHRLTLGRLRREIEPVAPADFVRFLLRWQHVHPATRLHGERGLAEAVWQLQGLEIPAAAWEKEILGARVARYDAGALDRLCSAGQVAWGRLAPRGDPGGEGVRAPPNRATPVSVVLRDDLPWLLAPSAPDAAVLRPAAREVLELLTARGALFFTDIAAALRRLPAELEDALWELVGAGLVTGDAFAGLRTLCAPRRLRPRSARAALGRWSLLRAGLQPAPREEAVESLARQLVRRWGVMFRDLLAREPRAPAWRELLLVYRRLEARGELRGGRFVNGFVGEQYALPEAVEALRASRRNQARGEQVRVSAVDPLNLVGILTPGPRVSAVLGNSVAYRDGVPLEADEPILGAPIRLALSGALEE